MAIVDNIENAKKKKIGFLTDYGTTQISLFQSSKAPISTKTLIVVSHGFQIQPAAIAQAKSGLPCFAFLVPIGVSLERTRYDTWLAGLAKSFVESPLAYSTTGVPDVIIGAHFTEIKAEEAVEKQLATVIDLCDVAVFEDMTSSNLGVNDYMSTASVPLHEFLGKWPGLYGSYNQFLMHCCRARWPPQQSGGIARVPSGLYTYNDDFKILLD